MSDCINCPYRSVLFEDLSESETTNLFNNVIQKSFKKGDIICSEGDDITNFIYLKKGLVKFFTKNKDDKTQIISIAKPLDFIGLVTTFSNKYQYSLSAIEDCEICFIDIKNIQSLILSNGEFALSIIKKISYAADHIIHYRFEINKKNLRGRIALILLDFSENIYKSPSFEIPISRKEIAELIGMTTENVIRIISEFKKDGIIEISGKRIDILNPDLLHKIKNVG